MTSTSPAYALAAPVDPSLRRVWDVRVYPSGTGEKVPAARVVAEVLDGNVRLALDNAVRRIGWQRAGPLGSDDVDEPFYAWDAWPLPPVDVPDWADRTSAHNEWEDCDAATGDVRVTHRHVVDTVGGVVVSVARTDRASRGIVSKGEIRVSVGEVEDGLTPDEADTLCGHVLAAARLAMRLRVTADRAPIAVGTAA